MYDRPLLKSIQTYSEELMSTLDARKLDDQRLIQKGMIVFRQQLVYGIKLSNEHVEATIRDVSPVQVTLFFHSMSASTCTCPEEGLCKHQIALFFTVMSKHQSVFMWMQDWKAKWNVEDVLSTLQRGSDLLTKPSPRQDPTLDKWLERIHLAYKDLDSLRNQYETEILAHSTYRGLLGFGPVEREWRPLFQLIVALESLRILEKLDPKLARSLDNFMDKLVEEARSAISILSATAAPFSFDPYLTYIEETSFKMLEEESIFPDHQLDLFWAIWTNLFRNAQKREKAWKQLQSSDTNREELTRKHIAYMLLTFLTDKDDLFLSLFRQSDVSISFYSIRWIHLLKDERQEERLYEMLPTFVQGITEYVPTLTSEWERTNFARVLFLALDRRTLERMDGYFIEKLYLQLLPYSKFQYTDYLLSKEEYRKWVEFQVFSGNSVEYIDRHILTMIEKVDPALLQPIYHMSILELIQNRGRDSYKKAVRYLKRLKQLYKKSKDLPNWERYFQTLLTNTKRLRAFQEECRKGKLINEES